MFDLSSIKKAISSLGDKRGQLRTKIEARQDERAKTSGAPPAKVDLKDMVSAWVDRAAAQYEKGLVRSLDPFVRKPGALLDSSRVLTFVAANVPPESNLTAGAFDSALCFAFGAALKSAMHGAIDRMDIAEGLPMAARAKRLRELDAEIAELLAEEAELLEAARASGIVME